MVVLLLRKGGGGGYNRLVVLLWKGESRWLLFGTIIDKTLRSGENGRMARIPFYVVGTGNNSLSDRIRIGERNEVTGRRDYECVFFYHVVGGGGGGGIGKRRMSRERRRRSGSGSHRVRSRRSRSGSRRVRSRHSRSGSRSSSSSSSSSIFITDRKGRARIAVSRQNDVAM